jgi:hypothetical protein
MIPLTEVSGVLKTAAIVSARKVLKHSIATNPTVNMMA